MRELVYQPTGSIQLGSYLERALRDPQWDQFHAAVAFAKYSGVSQIEEALAQFVHRGGRVRISVGVDLRGTSREGLEALLGAVGPENEVWICHNEARSTFHPKVYLFANDRTADALVGSGNLTEGGLYTNYEAAWRLTLDLTDPEDRGLYEEIVGVLDSWCDPDLGTSRLLDAEFLEQLVDRGYVPDEARSHAVDSSEDAEERSGGEKESLFARVPFPRPPRRGTRVREHQRTATERETEGVVSVVNRGFVMTLQQTDVGVGQITPGTSRRSPEIFVPLRARDADPEFWGYPGEFVEDPGREGKMDRRGVRVRLGGEVIEVNMMTWPVKHDFRLRSEALRSAGNVGDILRLEHAGEGIREFDYYAEIIPQGTSDYEEYFALCTEEVPNSNRRYGYY